MRDKVGFLFADSTGVLRARFAKPTAATRRVGEIQSRREANELNRRRKIKLGRAPIDDRLSCARHVLYKRAVPFALALGQNPSTT